jgi:hypothetical protein
MQTIIVLETRSEMVNMINGNGDTGDDEDGGTTRYSGSNPKDYQTSLSR